MERSSVAPDVRVSALLALLTCVVFANALPNGFVWDDASLIVDNSAIKRVGNIPTLFSPSWFRDDVVKPAYRPLAYISFAVDYGFWGLRATGYHATNLLLHVGSVLALYGFLRGVLECRAAAVLGALVFAVCPLRVEAVTYVKSRDEMLACVLLLAGLLLFQRFHRVKEQGGGTSAWPSFGLSMAAFALLPFAKEHGLVFPALLTAWVWCFGDPARRKDGLVQTGVAWLLMAGYGVFRATVVRPAGVGELASLEMPGESAFCAVATTLWFYAKCLALPFGLNADPDFELASLGVLGATVGMLVAVAAVVALVWWLRRDNVVGFGVMWLAVTLIPMSNVFFIGTRPLAEERLYLPSIGVCILLGRWVERSAPTLSGLGRGRRGSLKAALQNGNDVGLGGRVGRLGVAVLGLLGCLYAAGTAQRNAVWKDDFSVWRDTVRKSPQMPRAQFHLGLAYADAGRAKQAMGRYEMALRLNAGYVDVRNSLGVTHLAANDLDKAREEFEKVLAGSPAHPRALNNLGAVWLASGTEKRGEAERCFRRAAAARPQFAEARYNLGKMLAEDGKDAEAKREYEAAIAANPDFAKAYNGLGLLAERRGDLAEAERLYLTAATLDARAVEPRNNLAFLCLRQNREPAAAEMFREVLALKPDYEVAHFQLGRICEQAGQAVAALRHYQAAVALKPNYYQAQTNLGIILRILGRREEALAALRAAVQASPAEWQPHCMLGITLEELGQLSEAVEELKTALRLNPSASLASKHLESAQRKLQGQ